MAVDVFIWGSALSAIVKNPSAGKEIIMIKLLCLTLRNQKAITYKARHMGQEEGSSKKSSLPEFF